MPLQFYKEKSVNIENSEYQESFDCIADNLRPSPLKALKRRRMTLIAAFRTKEGVAICADSQETVTNNLGDEYRQTVQKIAPVEAGQYQIAIAGSGDGEFIDAFVELAERRLSEDKSAPSINRVRSLIENELDKFYKKHTDASMTLFVAAQCPTEKACEVWVSRKQYLRVLKDVELIGWDEPLYLITAKRLYRSGMSLMQAVLASVHVLVIGEESSNYIKGPFSLTVVRENGLWAEDSAYVDVLRTRLKEFEVFTNQILLACADTSIYSSALHSAIQGFAHTAQRMHEEQIEEAVGKMAKQGFIVNDPLAKVPPGILVEHNSTTGKTIVRHDVNGIEEMSKRINEALAQTKDGPDET